MRKAQQDTIHVALANCWENVAKKLRDVRENESHYDTRRKINGAAKKFSFDFSLSLSLSFISLVSLSLGGG